MLLSRQKGVQIPLKLLLIDALTIKSLNDLQSDNAINHHIKQLNSSDEV
jgi:hypothetical protein